jgi:hypothetical protein
MADCPDGYVKNPITGQCEPVVTITPATDGSPLGGIDPNYKIPTTWGTADQPYAFTTNDINIIYKISTDKLTSYQGLLRKAVPGYIPSTGNRSDPRLKSAFSKALTQINLINSDPTSPLRGKSLDEALAYLANNPVPAQGGGGLKAFRLNDPDTLKKAFEGGAQSALGRTLSPEDMNKLVNSFNQLDMDYQRAAAGGGGGTITQAPDAGVFAEKQAEKMAPVEAESYDYMNYMGALSKWMQG